MKLIEMFKQHEIDAAVETCYQTKLRTNTAQTAVVTASKVSPRSKPSLGFHFREGCEIGDVIQYKDGSVSEVVAVV